MLPRPASPCLLRTSPRLFRTTFKCRCAQEGPSAGRRTDAEAPGSRPQADLSTDRVHVSGPFSDLRRIPESALGRHWPCELSRNTSVSVGGSRRGLWDRARKKGEMGREEAHLTFQTTKRRKGPQEGARPQELIWRASGSGVRLWMSQTRAGICRHPVWRHQVISSTQGPNSTSSEPSPGHSSPRQHTI